MTLKVKQMGAKRPPRLVVYGPPKIGKSSLAADTPAPVFINTADAGIDNLPVAAMDLADKWETVIAQAEAVAKEKHDYRTLVIDTLGGIAELAAEYVCRTMFKGDWGDGGFMSYGKGWLATSNEFKRLLPWLDACVSRGMMVVITAHTGVQNVKNPVDGDYSKFAPECGDRRIWARIAGWADVILRADFDTTVRAPIGKIGKLETGEIRGRAGTETTRVLRCSGSAAEDAGCRVGYELPKKIPLSWEALENALGKDSETLKEVLELWPSVPKDKQAKALSWLGCELDQAPVAKLRTLLNKIKTNGHKENSTAGTPVEKE